MSVVVDITERKRIDRMKDEFVSTVSHELRTPMTSIAGSLGLLAGGAAGAMPESATRLLGIAHGNCQRLVRLINDILDIQKLEFGGVTFHHVSNAIKFSPARQEVVIGVAQSGSRVIISVRDHGAGIPDVFKPHVFTKFAQADGTDTRLKGGTGLGLSIVQQIVIRLGGQVAFENAAGGGTIFNVDLPAWEGVHDFGLELGSASGSAEGAKTGRAAHPSANQV